MSDTHTQVKRPLSPHLSIYKPIPTMVVSIVHRMTGVVLYLGTLLLVWWLIAAASSEAYFDYVNSLIGSFFGRLILFGFTWALIQHTLGGIKHLFWDVGYGFEKDFSTKIAWLSLVASTLLTFAVWYVGYMMR